MSRRYNFEFFRHHCGRTISIHGEPCFCEIERTMQENLAEVWIALEKIRDGLADTRSTPGQYMTKITKAEAFEIANDIITKIERLS